MKNVALRISAWGFTAAELANWPSDLIPVPVTQGPYDGAILVHARAAESFVTEAEAHPLADGRLAPAVLYATADVHLRLDHDGRCGFNGIVINFIHCARSLAEHGGDTILSKDFLCLIFMYFHVLC